MSPTKYLLGRWRKPQVENKNSPAAIEDSPVSPHKIPLSFHELLIAPVLLACRSYASFTILNISFCTVLPVYLATPINMGGLGLDPPTIRTILALMVLGGILQLLFFAPLHNRLGRKTLFLAMISLFIPIAALFPTMNHVTQVYGMTHLAWFLISLQIFFFACAVQVSRSVSYPQYPGLAQSGSNLILFSGATYIYINASALNHTSVGATIGLLQLLMSVMSTVGPSAINSAFALGIQKQVMGGYFAYWLMVGMAAISLAIGVVLPKKATNA